MTHSTSICRPSFSTRRKTSLASASPKPQTALTIVERRSPETSTVRASASQYISIVARAPFLIQLSMQYRSTIERRQVRHELIEASISAYQSTAEKVQAYRQPVEQSSWWT